MSFIVGRTDNRAAWICGPFFEWTADRAAAEQFTDVMAAARVAFAAAADVPPESFAYVADSLASYYPLLSVQGRAGQTLPVR